MGTTLSLPCWCLYSSDALSISSILIWLIQIVTLFDLGPVAQWVGGGRNTAASLRKAEIFLFLLYHPSFFPFTQDSGFWLLYDLWSFWIFLEVSRFSTGIPILILLVEESDHLWRLNRVSKVWNSLLLSRPCNFGLILVEQFSCVYFWSRMKKQDIDTTTTTAYICS